MTSKDIKNLIFVDCEANGKSPSTGKMTEFGAVAYPSKATFHGVLVEREPSEEKEIFEKFDGWLAEITKGERPIFMPAWLGISPILPPGKNCALLLTITIPFMTRWATSKRSLGY